MSLEERFWSKVDRTDDQGCWLWQAYISKSGYGRLYVSPARGPQLAHRVAWELANGPIPENVLVLHHCDTPPCVRVEHLYLGDHADNLRDCFSRGRARRARAEDNGQTKLSTEQLQKIRELAAAGTAQTRIAEQFGVHSSHISRILAGLRRTYD